MNYRRRLTKRKLMSKSETLNRKNYSNLDSFKLPGVNDSIREGEDEIYLIGNGPSLKYVDMSLLKDKHTISFNRAYISYEEWGFYPTYYMILDPSLIHSIKDDLNDLIKNNEDIKKFFIYSINNRVRKNMPVLDTEKDIIKNDKVFMFKTTENIKTFHYRSGISYYGTVGLCSLQFLHMMGYKKVYLLGSDLNYEMDIPGTTIHRRGYLESSEDSDPNHYRPDYFGKGMKYGKPPTQETIIRKWRNAYAEIKRISGFDLVSLTPNSSLNSFIPYKESELYDKEYIYSLKKK